MPKKGENIRKRADGRWEGRYKVDTPTDAKTKYHSVYGKTYKEVKDKIRLITSQPALLNEKKQQQPILIKEVITQWLNSSKSIHKGATEVKYEYLIEKHIIPELGDVPLSSVTSSLLTNFMNRKLEHGSLNSKGTLSPSYVRSIMSVVVSVLQYAVNEGMCQPLNINLQKPCIDKRDLEVLSAFDQNRLESALIHNIDETKLGILISLNTGLRIGEVCALSWDDIDFERQIFHIRSTVARVKSMDSGVNSKLIIDKPKTKSSLRDIPIPSKLLTILVSMKKQSKGKYVVSAENSFVSPRTYEYRYHKILDEYNIPSVNYHTLRHTFATRCIEVGVDVKTLSEILGHANVSITLNTYVHSSMELKRQQLEKLSILSA